MCQGLLVGTLAGVVTGVTTGAVVYFCTGWSYRQKLWRGAAISMLLSPLLAVILLYLSR